MLVSASLSVALYLFNNEGSWYLQVNVIYSWLCEGSIMKAIKLCIFHLLLILWA